MEPSVKLPTKVYKSVNNTGTSVLPQKQFILQVVSPDREAPRVIVLATPQDLVHSLYFALPAAKYETVIRLLSLQEVEKDVFCQCDAHDEQEQEEEECISPHSGTETPYSVSQGSNYTMQQTMGFTDQNAAYTYSQDSMPDPTFGIADTGGQSLEDFMCRPVRIADFEWSTTSSAFYETFNPWTLFFEDPKVINRISNFNLLRSRLHLKFQINGNSFHYGRLIASYQPLPDDDAFTVNRALFREDIVAASQQPHIYLDPTTSQGGDMILPFFWYYNALSIPEAEWKKMGLMTLRAINDLKHSNGATDSVTVTVWAWCEDVSLSIPTSENPDTIVPQSGMEGRDEYGTGPISRPASVLARAAGALVNAPVIGMYARATEMAASAMAAIATTFGYSRPAIISDIEQYKPTYVGNMANCNIPDSLQKLTVDAKQETTIDPRVLGLSNADEMSIKGLAMRESYLTTFDWTVDSNPNFFLWNSKVTPMLWSEVVNGTNTEIHMPACAYAVHPFEHWRGSMKFRFQIVASAHHKGRIRIVYDPRTAASDNFNTAFTQIVDIAEEKDLTVTVGWGTQQPYAGRSNPGTDSLPWRTGAGGGAVNPIPYDHHNGILFVEVLNSLTVPNSSINNDIQVNVFVSMCDDFEVANPNSERLDDFSWFPTPAEPITAQSGVEAQGDMEDTDQPSIPVSTNSIRDLAATVSPTDRIADVCFGEKIASFRQLCKRYNMHSCYSNVSGTDGTYMYARISGDFPYYRGFVGGSAIHVDPAGGRPYNYARMTIMNYLTPAYCGRRGGIRYKTQQLNQLALKWLNQGYIAVSRAVSATVYSENSKQLFFYNTNKSEAALQCRTFQHGHSGMHVQASGQNPVLEYELPYQDPRRFQTAKAKDMTFDPALQYHEFFALNYGNTVEEARPFFIDYVAGAEDFSLYFFTGCPVMYYAPTDPT